MKKGFTLVELLAVLLIVSILSAVGLPQYSKVMDKSRTSEALAMMRTIYDSSERVATEFGFRSYEQLLTWKSAHESGYDENNYAFPRLDMFDETRLPKGCHLGVLQNDGTYSNDKTVLTCARFVYKISVASGGQNYVAAKYNVPSTKRYSGTYLLFNRRTMQLSCQPASTDTDAEACDAYGLDVNNAGISF